MMRWITGVVAALLILGGVACFKQDALVLTAVGVLARLRTPVGPHREINWEPGPATATMPPGKRRPNIVLIVADDLGFNDPSFAGGGVAGGSVPTPHIDSIAQEGVSFTNGYSGSGTCAPSRAALMSGRYPTRFGFEFTPMPPAMLPMIMRLSPRLEGKLRHPITYVGVRGESLPFREMGMPAEEISLAELLQGAGYHTVHIGKWHLGEAQGMTPQDQGFNESLNMASFLYLPEGDPGVVNSKQEFDPVDRLMWKAAQFAVRFNGGHAFQPGGYKTDYYTDEAVKVIEANRNRPFFLYLAYHAPHTPLQATRADYDALSHIEDHTLRVYAAMIRALDRCVGRVLWALEENGLTENTLVIFTSDNGGAHYIGLPEVNRPFRGWKMTFFEGGIHVPYFMKWPEKIARGIRFDPPVHHFDVYGTAAAAAGISMPDDRPIDAVDLLPFVRGEAEGDPHERLFWRSGHYQVVIADGWKLQVIARPHKTWLFNLRNDPTEQRNLAGEHPERVRRMKAMLAAHNATQSESAWPSLLEAPINIDETLFEADTPNDEYVYWPN